MSSELSPYSAASKLPAPIPTNAFPGSRQGRAIARSDRSAELAARLDYNRARVAVHREHLDMVVEKVRNQSRAELVEDVVLHATAVDSLVSSLSNGKPGLELILRGIQESYSIGEQQRIMRRGMGI